MLIVGITFIFLAFAVWLFCYLAKCNYSAGEVLYVLFLLFYLYILVIVLCWGDELFLHLLLNSLIIIIPSLIIYGLYKFYELNKKKRKKGNSIIKNDAKDNEVKANKDLTIEEEILRSKLFFFLYRNRNDDIQSFNNETPATIEKNICGHKVVYYNEPHKYLIDGINVPSITDIVGVIAIYYGWDDYRFVNQKILENAAQKGTLLHKSIEQYERYGITSETVEFENYLKIKTDQNFKVLENEKIVILSINNKPVAVGRLDLIIEQNNLYSIMEIKRTSKYYKEKVALQLNLYRLAYLQSYKKFDIQSLKLLRLYNNVVQFEDVDIDESMAFRAIQKYSEICQRLIGDVV